MQRARCPARLKHAFASPGQVLTVAAALLLVIGWRNLRARHSKSAPRVFDKIAGMGPLAVMLLSGGVTIANPKNLVILLGAGSVAGKQGLSATQLALTLVVFTIIATAPFLLMVGYLAFGGTAATRNLERWRQWLLRNNRLIMGVINGDYQVVRSPLTGRSTRHGKAAPQRLDVRQDPRMARSQRAVDRSVPVPRRRWAVTACRADPSNQGQTKAAAERALKEALRDRGAYLAGSVDVTAETKVAALAEAWWTHFERLDRSPGTKQDLPRPGRPPGDP
ncbi:MAG: GAP family protein [Streptosporangiaceae bacterium]|jgi:hypothetical protein